MVERYKVDETNSTRVDEAALKDTVTQIFRKVGVPDGDSELAADVLVIADRRGVDSHGVSNQVKVYLNGFDSGDINPRPNWRVVRETPGTATIDSDLGLGIIVGPKAMEIAIEKARNVGVGIVNIGNGHHLGMISYHAMIALSHDMIGICMASCPPTVMPTFGAETNLGTNPIAIAAPADQEAPFVFDAATSVITHNKLGLARRLNQPLLPGWVADENGTPLMEEAPPPPLRPDGHPVALLLPLGSTRELGSHKGYGFAAMVDVMAGILGGAHYGAGPDGTNFGHHLAAYNIEAFMDPGLFKRTMDKYLRMLMSTRPAPGHDRVLYPGLLEAEAERDRNANGIPLHYEVVQWFRDICAEMAIPYTLTEQPT